MPLSNIENTATELDKAASQAKNPEISFRGAQRHVVDRIRKFGQGDSPMLDFAKVDCQTNS